MKVIEVRFHSRRDRGAIMAARILAAAFRLSGRDASWHIPFGWERAVNFEAATSRADETAGKQRLSALAVFYPPLLEVPDVWMRFENPELILINSRDALPALDICEGHRVAVVDASGIAGQVGPCYGVPSLVAPMIGALAGAGNIVLGIHLIEAIKKSARAFKLTVKDYERLVRALETGYNTVRIRGGKCEYPQASRAAHVDCA